MISFSKYHGLGNDFILLDNRSGALNTAAETTARLCDRHFGIGADGVILAENSGAADIKMVLFNSDGSRAEMCGNGLRCFSKYVYEKLGIKKSGLAVETDAGILTAELTISNNVVEAVRVNMGSPVFEHRLIPCTIEQTPVLNRKILVEGQEFYITSLLMGVPHTVLFTEDLRDEAVISLGKKIENSTYFPRRTNVNFVRLDGRGEITVRTWERGAGYTHACGTGACASAVAGIMNGYLDREALAHLRGGDLRICWQDDGVVFMTGPAEEVFEGICKLPI